MTIAALRPLRAFALASVAALALTACDGTKTADGETAAVAEKIAAPAGKAWSETVAATPEGGFVMGNPDAPIKLVEYGSLTCSHCADFSKESSEPMKAQFIDTGRVSYEFRSFMRNGVDATATAIAVCAGADKFFPLTESIFAGQADLFAGANAAPAAAESALALPEAQRFPALAKVWKLDSFFASRGVTADQINTCLADIKNVEKIEADTRKAVDQYQINATPTFLLNGEVMAGVGNWTDVSEKLRAAGAR